MSLADKISQAFIDFDILNQVVEGDKNTIVQTAGGTIPSIARMADNIVVKVAAALTAVSNTPNALGAGLKIFDIGAGKAFPAGAWVSATCSIGIISGTVVSLSGSILTINILHVVGEGSAADWAISLAGAPGAAGVRGLPGLPGSPGLPGLPGPPGVSAPGSDGGGVDVTLVTTYPWDPPAAIGTVLGSICQGADLYETIANGDGTTHNVLVEANSLLCPVVPVTPPSADCCIPEPLITKFPWET